jgi:heterodisulfide reductase subunit A-like polyferredoxin
MYAIKESVIAKEHEHEIAPTIFYMDIRAHGKDFDRYVQRAKDEYGIKFTRARVAEVNGNGDSGSLLVTYETGEGTIQHEPFDLVVLSVGFQGNGRLRELGTTFNIPINRYGFVAVDPFNPIATKVPGIFISGPAQEPKDIPETVMQASAGAAAAAEILADTRWSEVVDKSYPEEIDVAGKPLRVGVFVCHCGVNIGGTVDVPAVVEYAKTLPDIAYAECNLYTCSQDTQEHIKEMIQEHDLNRVIVASCTPRTHEPLFQETIREAGLNKHLFGMANIRDQCSWIHMGLPAEATEKARDLLRMAVAKIRLVEPLPKIPLDIIQRAMVLGGGPAGMSASLSLARQGFEVDLVERTDRLGGNLNNLTRTLEGGDVKKLLHEMRREVTGHNNIAVHLNAELESVEGFVGNYTTTIRDLTDGDPENGHREIEHGVVILATGAGESKPEEYGYGKLSNVYTGIEFENRLAGWEDDELPSTVVFIQCVGSREEQHQYCSRVCCRETVKNALALKARNPAAEIYVLYRDMRTYGFSESYYQEARDAGVVFLEYEENEKPSVSEGKGSLQVEMIDLQIRERVEIETDCVVLASRVDPEPGNEKVSQLFKVPLNQDGYFLEAHVKLRPVDFATEGVFLAGMAHNPKTIAESIAQGKAAAARAGTIISKDVYEAEATIAAVNEDLCDGCGICVGVCEYNALEIEEKPDETKVVKLNEAVCKGCGCCVAACPSGAMEQKGFKNDQILAEIDAALAVQ